MNIIKKRNLWFAISGTLVFISILLLIAWNLRYGIDFTGGSLLEVEYQSNRPALEIVQTKINEYELGNVLVQPTGERGYLLRFMSVNEEKHRAMIDGLQSLAGEDGGFEEMRFDSVGPAIGEELKTKSLKAMFIVLLAIVLYIAWSFRKVSYPVSSWKYGMVAIITLFHDVMIVVGLFVILGHYFNVEINTTFVAALLTLLGYSVNDTIVIFDRIRENLARSGHDFETTIEDSVRQTIGRSINTSLTTLLALSAIYFFGGETVRYFVLALMAGVLIGTYSSIFVASPLLVIWHKLASGRRT